jgi:transcriptional regulator with XRE-family HTH domain
MSANNTQASIGSRIRLAIERADISQVELAKRIGVTQSCISNLVTDSSRKPNIFTLNALAAALNVSEDWIRFGEGPACDPLEESLLAEFRKLDHYKKSIAINLIEAPAYRREQEDLANEMANKPVGAANS